MKYLVLIYGDDTLTGSPADLDAVRALTKFKDELAVSGELVSSEGLAFPSEGRVVQVRDGARVVTDGPYGEAKEQLAGFFLVEVADDDRAQQVAGRVSAIVGDRVELRPTVLST
ncbi:YciI family protein [Kribbella sp. NPDC051620]|uniref:YciI family protein n=1 Tax=Kribbella sp. NPDC051620 TaxID=3364120 RepID=UPI0037BD9120